MKKILILLCFLATSIAQGVGFTGRTKVKTPSGYTRIDEIKKGDVVICYDFKSERCVERKVIQTHTQKGSPAYLIYIDGQEIGVSGTHKFYETESGQWVPVKDLWFKHLISKNCNTEKAKLNRIIELDAEATFHDICVENHHNFFVTESDFLVHNVIPLFVWGTGTIAFVGWEAVGFGLASTVAGIGATWLVNNVMRNVFGASGGVDYDWNARVLDEVLKDIRTQQEEMTRKDARKVAKEKGWTEVPDPGFNTHGQPAFKSGRKIITPDVDGHRGGRWKVFWNGNPDDRTTYKDDDLTIEVGD